MCVLTDGEFNQLLSPEELTFCCHLCGFGCHGGYPIQAWKFFKRHGLVTGGNYNTSEVNININIILLFIILFILILILIVHSKNVDFIIKTKYFFILI